MADVEKIKLNGSSLNIKDANAVSVESQSLTAQQKTQARENIGAASVDSVPTSLAELSDDSTHRLVTDVEKTTWNSTIPSTAKGASNGVAELDSNGKVPSSQLPSFVDDVIEGYYNTLDDRFYEESTFVTLIEPVAGKSWVDILANKSYRWTGSVYVRVDEGVQIGETSDTAYAGNKGKANADAIAAINEVIPSTATSQNPLATADDIPTDAVKYTAQTLTDAQKTQARENIGVVQPDWRQSNSSQKDYIKNKPPILAVYPGTSGSFTGGTGMNSMNEATKQNSAAYGYGVSAKGDYSAAFGYYLQALHDYEIAYGKFNQSNDDTAFSIGDGTSNSDRHNLMELKTDGTLLLNGNAVKTEGGDNDKLRLGQICGLSDGSSPFNFYHGFLGLLATSSTTSILFQNDDIQGNILSNLTMVYQFQDFVGYSDSSTNTVYVRPLAGRTAGKTKTGAWILVESCYYMFYNCSGVTSLNLSMFDTSEVKDMSYMFYGCTALTALDLSLFDTRNVITMWRMFGFSSVFTNLDLSSFDTSKVTDMSGMFYHCTALATLDISSFDMSNVLNYTDMFGKVNHWAGITTLKCPKINPHDDIPLPRTLYSQDGTAYTNLPVTTGTSIELRQSWT